MNINEIINFVSQRYKLWHWMFCTEFDVQFGWLMIPKIKNNITKICWIRFIYLHIQFWVLYQAMFAYLILMLVFQWQQHEFLYTFRIFSSPFFYTCNRSVRSFSQPNSLSVAFWTPHTSGVYFHFSSCWILLAVHHQLTNLLCMYENSNSYQFTVAVLDDETCRKSHFITMNNA